ncbi:Cytochrome P450 71A1 [Acorus calamus]|uniref:Cytochrome P450 71A1 n=1 Tax=Acorus calamus TaxID=4465 RepID=A0AAV9F176_ACOCL|nr:Cytochrome P450 71A1 [Acorus calamus]
MTKPSQAVLLKKIIMIHLLNTKRVQSFRYVREEEVANMVAKIQNLSSSGGLVDFSEAFGVLSNNIICSVVFGRKFSREEGENYFHLMLAAFLDLLGTFAVGEFIPSLAWVSRLNGLNARVKRNNEEFDAFFERVLDEHIESRRDVGEGGGEFLGCVACAAERRIYWHHALQG